MNGRNIARLLVFMIFFAAGAGAVGLSVLVPELHRHYHYRRVHSEASQSIDRLRRVAEDYDILLVQLEEDPSLLERVATLTFGMEPNEPNTVFPKSTALQEEHVKMLLAESVEDGNDAAGVPLWLSRVSERRARLVLFFSGGGLIFVSFLFFGASVRTD